MFDALKKPDIFLTSLLFVATLILTGVSVWLGLNFENKRITELKQYKPVVKNVLTQKESRIFEDAVIRVDSKFPVVVTRIRPKNYKITINADTVEIIPIELTNSVQALKITGKHDIDEILYRSFNGVVYAGYIGSNPGEEIFFVQKGKTLFKIIVPGVSQSSLEEILSSISYKTPGEFASPDFIDTKGEKSLVEDSAAGMKTDNLEGFAFSNGKLQTNMFSMNVLKGWDLYNTSECIVMFDKNRQSEQIAIFTLKSINFTKKQYEHFLDRVYGGHQKLGNLKLGGLEYIHSVVDGGSTQFQTFLHPINQTLGLMIQSRSAEGELSIAQRDMISSIILK